jgi:tRNA(fMet)-specific endonuclease VapC
MPFVLDTTVMSALMRADVVAARHLLATRPGDVGVPQPVLAELHYGLARLPASKKKRLLEDRLAVLLQSLSRLAWDDAVSERFGEAKAALEARGERVDDFDLAIAAHALALDATVVTSNTKHFDRIPRLRVVRWT